MSTFTNIRNTSRLWVFNVLAKIKQLTRMQMLLAGLLVLVFALLVQILLYPWYQKTFFPIRLSENTFPTSAPTPTFMYQKPTTPEPTPVPYFTITKVDKSFTSSQKIAYIYKNQLWSAKVDGSETIQLTKGELVKKNLVVSPNTKKLYFNFYEKHPQDNGLFSDGALNSYGIQGMGGKYMGIGYYDTETKTSHIIYPYTNALTPHDYFTLSPDGKYIAAWLGKGEAARILDSLSGQEIASVSGAQKFGIANRNATGVSPFVFIPRSNKVSYILNGDLIRSNVDGTEKETLTTGLQTTDYNFESANTPALLEWSPSGRYVVFEKGFETVKKKNPYSDSTDLYSYSYYRMVLFDTVNKTETQIGKFFGDSDHDDIPDNDYFIKFSDNEQSIYLRRSYNRPQTIEGKTFSTVVKLDIQSGKKTQVIPEQEGWNVDVQKDLNMIIIYEQDKDRKPKTAHQYTLDGEKKLSCPTASATNYYSRQHLLSPDKSLIFTYGNPYDRESTQNAIYPINSCKPVAYIKTNDGYVPYGWVAN